MPQTVLIVEDSENVAENLEVVLTTIAGITVMIVPSGREALKLLVNGDCELAALVTDLNLPFVDGFALIEAARGNQRYSRLPIVVVSGDSHPETPERLRRLGANAYFPKPYSPAEIKRTLEGLLNAR
jgi:DNA-binding response OmpR family regulator